MSIENILLSPWLLTAILVSAFGLFLILTKELLYWALGIRQLRNELSSQKTAIEDINFEIKLIKKNQAKIKLDALENKESLEVVRSPQTTKPSFPLNHLNESPPKEASQDFSLTL